MNDGLSVKSNEVLVCSEEIISLQHSALVQLKAMAASSSKRRARICAHKDNSALIQEMIIVINRESYIRPHRHENKCESFHLIEGDADIVVFKENGDIEKVIRFSQEHAFYYRLDTSYFHTIVVRSENIIFHEVTNGPFIPNATEYAEFSATDGGENIDAYRKKLDSMIGTWLSINNIVTN